ncbi:isoprenoid synthase domain-containing protein [Podospora aff. communis PSN243]|uniref:Terpene synthase n=1 Tax=Podospora aff. communis PSN243 TaxID=3040156 RepID=A0AAV9GHU8_9PEZI|nr:isoprenoid synthase domain-containing protein [Podospora aff. communis PSN243]
MATATTSTRTITLPPSLPTPSPPKDVDTIRHHLKGQTLHLPNLFTFYSQWPNEISPHYAHLQTTIEAKIQQWIDPADALVRLKARKVNLPLFCAIWYPRSSLDRLLTMAWFSMWLFLWDDVIEDTAIPSSSSALSAQGKITSLHDRALAYVEYHLGLVPATIEPETPTKYCTLFKHAGVELQRDCTVRERRGFYEEVERYMRAVEVESEWVGRRELPGVEEYWEHRLGTSSVYCYCALGEYMGAARLPQEMLESEEVRVMWYELNRHIVTMNDIVSLKKELNKSLHSLIPIIVNETGADLNSAVASLLDILQVSGDRINNNAERLLAMAGDDEELREKVLAWIVPFWTNMTGSYWWS